MLAFGPSLASALHTDGARMRPDLRPMLATLTDKPFDDPAWVFETKWDGFRAIAVAGPGHASLYSRNGNDISPKYPSICAALAAIKHEAVLDGELVAVDQEGRSRFQLLQNAEREKTRLLYCVFDLLYLDGKDLRGETLPNARSSLHASCRIVRCCSTALMSRGRGSKPSTRLNGRRKKASSPSWPAGATTPASARANG